MVHARLLPFHNRIRKVVLDLLGTTQSPTILTGNLQVIEKFETEAHILSPYRNFLFELLFEIIAHRKCKTRPNIQKEII